MANETPSVQQLTQLQTTIFIGHSGLVSLLALARDLGRGEDRRCCLVQGRRDLVDVVQTDHGEDKAMMWKEREVVADIRGVLLARCLPGWTSALGREFRAGLRAQEGRPQEAGVGAHLLAPLQPGPGARGHVARSLPRSTYQVVTQTRWMRPDAKRANRRHRRTRGAEREGSGEPQNTRYLLLFCFKDLFI